MTLRLDGKTAVITGAGSGMGRAFAETFAREGATVACLDLDRASSDDTVEAIRKAGGTAHAFTVDVADSSSVASAAEAVLAQYGSINVLVNNAGISGGLVTTLDTTEELWNRVIAVNLTGSFLVTHAFLPSFLALQSGSIINMSSIGALVAVGNSAYTASKGGVLGLTRQMAVELAPKGIRVNAILPGVVETPMSAEIVDSPDTSIRDAMPARRFAQAHEVAELALFLASDESRYVVGASHVIDGGWTAQ